MTKHGPITAERTAKLFKNGRSQAVRIPKEFEFIGKEVTLRKEGDRLIIEPVRKPTLVEVLDWLAKQPPCDDEFPEIEDYPPEPVDL